jgi:P4 family phage/plasmid primase-like protien
VSDNRPLAERLFTAGFTDLIPVIPPGAALTPKSKIAPDSIGKIPGERLDNGLWRGFNWRALQPTIEDVRAWQQWGANVGLRTDHFPCVDIDCADEKLAEIIEDMARTLLGPAPSRIGNPPKRALMYRLGDPQPFGRLRLHFRQGERKYLVEILGEGQQYVVSGTHPKTGRAYTWDVDPVECVESGEVYDYGRPGIRAITLAQAKSFLEAVKETVELLGYETMTQGDGTGLATRRADQQGLIAPSMDALREVVDALPNTTNLFPTRDQWLKVGAAILGAAGPDEEREAEDLFVFWSSKWEEGNDPEYARSELSRIRAPYSVGWNFLAELARAYGNYNDADFPVDMERPPETTPTSAEDEPAIFLSEQWLAGEVVARQAGVLRYVPKKDIWLVWGTGRWTPDAELLAEDTVKLELRRIASRLVRQGATDEEKKRNYKMAVDISTSGKLSAVSRLVKIDRAIAVSPESLDFDPWMLNTPGGMIDLRTGALLDPDPDQLCTRSTAVAPAAGPSPRWFRFLDEATGGDASLQMYLQRWAGYCLTGVTREQQYTFIWGEGGNGKGVFLTTLMGLFGTYHRDAPMETFISSNNDRHPTELAHLAGARLVTASETDAGRRWDEAKLKRMTGGDPITARAMREDFFTYIPQFKLAFIGNHKPEIRNLDEAMRRRTHLVPFTQTPKEKDKQLAEKLREEWPAILAWLIDGCLEWQRSGLQPPDAVLEATEDYFADSDPLGQWLAEVTVPAGADEWVPLKSLFDSWREWCGGRGEYVGKTQQLSQKLLTKRYRKRQHPRTRTVEFAGLQLVNGQNPLEGMAS